MLESACARKQAVYSIVSTAPEPRAQLSVITVDKPVRKPGGIPVSTMAYLACLALTRGGLPR